MSILSRILPNRKLGPSTGAPSTPAPAQAAADAEKYPDRESDPAIDSASVQGWMEAHFTKLKTAYLIYHQNIWQAILFYVGQTWLDWDDTRKQYNVAQQEDDWTPMPRINYFAPAMDAIASNFKSIPPVECTARDADGDEQYRRWGIAEVCNRLAKDVVLRTGLKADFQSKGEKAPMAAQWFVLSGSLFTGVRMSDLAPIQSDTLGTITQRQVDIELLPTLSLLPRPGATEIGGLSGSPFTIVSRRMGIQETYTRFQVNVTPDREYLDGYNSQYQSALNYWYTGFNATDLSTEDSALVTEVYIPPASADNSGIRDFAEEGLYAIYANNAVKYAEPWGFPDHPVTKIDYMRVPTLFFGRTPAFDMVPLQIEVQAYESIIKLHAMTNAATPWVVDANTQVGEITGRGDRVIKYRSLGPNSPPPKREQSGSMDAGVYEQRKYLVAQFQNISGAVSVFQGRQEGSVTASSAIAQLRGQAEQMFSGPVDNWNNGWKETVRKAVLFIQSFYTLPQIVAIVGDGMYDAINDFMSCNLGDCVEWIPSGHGLPRTQDELRQEMLTLFDKKALDPSDPNVKERLFRLFGETGMLTNFSLDATRARYENKMMKKGVAPVFRPAIEDLQTHYTLHTEMVKSLEFDRLTPQVQELFLAHVMETKQAMVPPAPPAPPASLAFTAKLEDMPAPLTDAVLESHGLHPAPDVAPPPPHHVGKSLAPGQEPTPIHGRTGTATRGGATPRKAHDGPPTQAHMPTHGLPTGSPLHPQGQGMAPIGASQGAPPAPPQ